MARIQALIPDELDERIRRHLLKRYGIHLHGKISEIVREALELYLDKVEAEEEEVEKEA